MAVRLSGKVKTRSRMVSDNVELLQQAVEYFTTVKERTPSNGNLHLDTIESIAFDKGLSPDVIESLVDVAMSARLVDRFNIRLLKCLIPASVVPECAVTNAISWMCTRKPTITVQVLFIRWLITVFDLLDSKKQLHSLYGIIFFYLQNDKLCPYICHLLYLLTKKENVKRFRVKKLIDLQAKMGMQPHLMALLLLYKIHAPEYVCLACAGQPKNLQVSGSFWKKAIERVQNNGYRQLSRPPELVNLTEPPMRKRKKKMHRELIPVVSSAPHLTEQSCSLMQSKSFPLEQLATFFQLLDNFDRIEIAICQSRFVSSLIEFADCSGDSLQREKEFIEFLNIIIRTQEFLQEGFSCCEDFVFKSLSLYDSLWCSSQILALLTRISPSTDMISFYFDPLMKLFFTSSIYFKCSVIESLTSLLMKWLTWHSVCVADLDRDIPNVLQSPQNVTLSGLVNSVSELVEFTARISIVALQMEAYNSLLLHFILNFYETVSDMYLKYNLPLVILPPAGIIYPALLSLESVSLNQLCHIMYRYRTNLTALKSLDSSTNAQIGLKVNRKTFQQYNAFMKAAVSCLWTTRNFEQDIHPMGIGIEYNLLAQTKVPDPVSSFTLVNHPALMGHAINFTQKGWPNGKKRLHAIQGKTWNWYVEYLYNQGLDGLKHFLESCIHTVSSSEH
ncbi:centromere protein I [Rhincodon typus]|uniref:centromere protein I n=1 Tax=Rhincodon typus TaxID=259920 RepID=UPI00202E4190|nr:centromere protein I [Rhincodon typus]